MKLDFSVELSPDDAPVFERCAKIMLNGCLVTGSLQDGMDMEYQLRAVYSDDRKD